MIDLKAVALELHNARQARIAAELGLLRGRGIRRGHPSVAHRLGAAGDGPPSGRRPAPPALTPRYFAAATLVAMLSQIIAAMSGPPSRRMMRMPVGEVTLISVR